MLAWCGHDLTQHLRNTYTLVVDPSNYERRDRVNLDSLKREIDTIVSRLSRILGMDREFVKEMLAISAYLHDIGKAVGYYQGILQDKCGKDEERVSLKGHELVSMWVAYHVFNALNVKHKEPFLAGIALHHSARRSIDEAYIGLMKNLTITHSDVDNIITALKELSKLSKAWLDTDYIAAWLHQDIDQIVKLKINDYIRELVNSGVSKYGELVTYVISIVDDVDSYINRKGFTPVIIRKFFVSIS